MLNKESESLLAKLLLIGPALVTLVVYTQGVTDPVNVTKLLAIGVFAFSAIAILPLKTFKFIWTEHKTLVLAQAGFILSSLSSMIQSDSPMSQQLYGVYGRNNGFLLYLFLLLLSIATVSLNRISTANNLLKSLVIAGGVNLLYCGWVLAFGDFLGWSNPYGNILGTLGNPNFIGAFLGMFSSVLVSLAIVNFRNLKYLILIGLAFGLTVLEIVESHAIQGRVLVVLGLLVNGFFFIRSRFKNQTPLAVFSLLSAVGGVIALLGTLQIGPLTKVLYKESVSLRGEYWYAGLTMAKSHLFSGVGFDSYGDWYRLSRRDSALIKPGIETVSNTAHNVIIDIFAFGGLPLLVSYLLLVTVVFVSVVKHARRNRQFDSVFVGLVGAWLCYQLQSVISINQIGLAIWGWVLGSAIIAYERISRGRDDLENPTIQNRTRKSQSLQVISPNLRAGIAFVVGALIAVPPLSADMKWRNAQLSRQAETVEAVLLTKYLNPANSFKYLQIVGAFEGSNLTDLAHKYTLEAVKFNPRSYESWRLFTLIQSATPEEKQIAIAKMKELDPKNPKISVVSK